MTVGLQVDLKIKGKIKENILKEISDYANLTIKDEINDSGLEAIIIEESHVIIKRLNGGYYISLYTCGEPQKEEKALYYLLRNSKIKNAEMLFLKRGEEYGDKKEMRDPFKIFKEIVGFYPKKIDQPGRHIVIDLNAKGEYLKRVENFSFIGNPLAKYNFTPYGASGIIGNGDKLITFHTWPEYGLGTFDLYGSTTEEAIKLLRRINGNGRILSYKY